ncbi:alpha-soluble NSF attachment protein 2-like [Rosa rugosa]|uniref:alpha-soluble NSF attachment protein 2-like n=1 Tax=Rosa rugosa TaxID=74645 RepID=UPI002B41550F|nr:alpha-soluble NSF attachment protein 2-like [Rosa rugosa]
MEDHIAREEKFEKKANKKLHGWRVFGSKRDDIAELLDHAATSYKLPNAWDKAKEMYIKLAKHHLKTKTEHEAAATAFVDAAHCCDITSVDEAISCLDQGVDYLLDTGKFNAAATCSDKAARLYKEIAELFESQENIEKAIEFFEKASELPLNEELSSSVNYQCYEKAAQLAAQNEQYPKAIEIYENMATYSLNHSLLKHKVKGHLFKAGICRLCRGDDAAVAMAKQYADSYPSFRDTWQCKSLEDIAVSVDKRDLTTFRDVVKKFESMTPPDSWTTNLLLRVEEKLKASKSVRTRRPTKALDLKPSSTTTFGDRGRQRKMCTGLERSRTTIGGTSTATGSKLLRSSLRIKTGVDTSKEEIRNMGEMPLTNWPFLRENFRRAFLVAGQMSSIRDLPSKEACM